MAGDDSIGEIYRFPISRGYLEPLYLDLEIRGPIIIGFVPTSVIFIKIWHHIAIGIIINGFVPYLKSSLPSVRLIS